MHLIGISHRQKAYKLYDLDRHTVFVSRDVHFEEQILPFKHQNISDHTLPQFLPVCPNSADDWAFAPSSHDQSPNTSTTSPSPVH